MNDQEELQDMQVGSMEDAKERMKRLISFLSPSSPGSTPTNTNGGFDFIQASISSSAVEFYEPIWDSDKKKWSNEISLTNGPWAKLPLEWKVYFERFLLGSSESQKDQMMRSLSRSEPLSEFPDSLSTFLKNTRDLPLPRSLTNNPIYSTLINPESRPSIENRSKIKKGISQIFKNLNNNTKVSDSGFSCLNSQTIKMGMSPKKSHEVERLKGLILSLAIYEEKENKEERGEGLITKRKKILDLGSGQGHLSRTLAKLGFEVIAIDKSHQQNEGGIRLAGILSKQKRDRDQKEETQEKIEDDKEESWSKRLKFKTIELDVESVEELIVKESDQALLIVGLHSCGDLSTTILESFCSSSLPSKTNRNSKISNRNSMVLIGCCYNLCDFTSSKFPFSSSPKGLSKQSFFSDFHRQLACQSPKTWSNFQSKWDQTRLSIKKLQFRSFWESQILTNSYEDKNYIWSVNESDRAIRIKTMKEEIKKIRLGRLPDRVYSSYFLFHEAATKKSKTEILQKSEHQEKSTAKNNVKANLDMIEDENDYFKLFIGWTIRCLLGPCLESVIVLDRFIGICEKFNNNKDSKISDNYCNLLISIMNLFDQDQFNSLRNIAIVIHPLS